MAVPEATHHVRSVAAGLGFTEGPLWTLDERLFITSVSRGLLYAVDEDSATVVAAPGGRPTGLAQSADGTVWIAQTGTSSKVSGDARDLVRPGIQVLEVTGKIRWVVTDGVYAPNDCVIGPDGRLWFTDPVEPAFDPVGPSGRLCALSPSTGEVTVVAEGLRFPNGLAFTPDGAALYVAETGASNIRRLELDASADAEALVWADLGGMHPDGLAVDSRGRVYAAAPRDDAVLVLDGGGRLEETIPVPAGSFPTSVCFGGADRSRLYITAVKGGHVYVVERDIPGASLH